MKRTVIAITVVLTLLSSGLMIRQAETADPPISRPEQAEGFMMRSKMKQSQAVLEGLLRKDMRAVVAGAHQMKIISEAAEWPRARDAVYEHYSEQFRRQCTELEHLAKTGNHQGAHYAYLHMTSLCIQCHDYVRDSLKVARNPNQGNIRLIPSQWPE